MIDIQAQKSVRIIMDGSITIDNYNVQKLRNLTPPEKTNMQKKPFFPFLSISIRFDRQNGCKKKKIIFYCKNGQKWPFLTQKVAI